MMADKSGTEGKAGTKQKRSNSRSHRRQSRLVQCREDAKSLGNLRSQYADVYCDNLKLESVLMAQQGQEHVCRNECRTETEALRILRSEYEEARPDIVNVELEALEQLHEATRWKRLAEQCSVRRGSQLSERSHPSAQQLASPLPPNLSAHP
jgi:TFIIF-interacting CTD phosphatase-like protein